MIAQSFTHAILTDTHIIYRHGNGRLTWVSLASNVTVCDLLTLADTHRLHSFWVCPGSHYSDTLTHGFIEAAESHGYEYRVAYRPHNERGRADHITHAHLWKKEGTRADRRSTYILFPEWDWWEWEEKDPVTLLAAIHYIERALPVHINQGAPLAGRELVRHLHSEKHQAWLRIPEIDYEAIPYNNAGKDVAFNRKITYQDGLFIHAYDKNSMYLGAATGAMLGAGTPDYFAPGTRPTPNLKLPGFWHCKIEIADSRYNGTACPTPLAKHQEWVSTPLLKFCYELGYHIEVIEGYQWADHHRTLETWGNALWTARTQLRTDHTSYPHEQGRELAATGIKTIATKGLGLFNSEKSATYDRMWYRPDFWVTIVELAKERMIRKVLQMEEKSGLVPFAIATDCLYYLSPDSDPYTALPGLTDREDKLGGFKVKHQALPLTPTIAEQINAASSAGRVAKIIRLYEQELKVA